MQSQLAELADVSLWSMSPDESAATLTAATRLSAQLAELEMRVAEHAKTVGVGESVGATSTSNFWAHATNQTRTAAHGKMRLAVALAARPALRTAVAAGDVLVEQARVIVDAVEVLPVEHRDEAEAMLIKFAAEHDAKALKRLGRRILELLDPEAAEAHEAKQLEDEEREAARSTKLTMTDDGHGKVHGRFTLPSAQAAMLKKALLAFAAPKHRAAVDGSVGERRPSAERMGQAFVELIERYPTKKLPKAGGVNATVVVTMDISTLMGGLKAASLDTVERITAGQARRLACEAGIIPAVLGGKSQVLDLGRKRRFHTESQRIAMAIEQGGCNAEGCDWPPGLCHCHHEIPWHLDGETSVEKGMLLCPHHHARAHDPKFTMTKQAGGKVAFTRRT
ncbi:HNH endonuclease signature motif containing protein [Nocardioides ginsengisegetis]